MIFITGDTHNLNHIQKLYNFAAENVGLKKSDYMIVAGDLGVAWSEKTLEDNLNRYGKFPFTVLFVDGNHENFNILNSYPVEEWRGGKVHMLRPDIIHLMRGQVYQIEDKTFFTFGGATSTDKYWRKEGESWWKEEMPSFSEFDEGIANLKRYGNKVDYIITHSCDEKALWYPPLRTRSSHLEVYPENQMLSYFEDIVDYGHWYFGHYHLDGDLTAKKTALFEDIVMII